MKDLFFNRGNSTQKGGVKSHWRLIASDFRRLSKSPRLGRWSMAVKVTARMRSEIRSSKRFASVDRSGKPVANREGHPLSHSLQVRSERETGLLFLKVARWVDPSTRALPQPLNNFPYRGTRVTPRGRLHPRTFPQRGGVCPGFQGGSGATKLRIVSSKWRRGEGKVSEVLPARDLEHPRGMAYLSTICAPR